jgi:glycosyltransferase involved in cell wall biosynthesis
VSDPSLFYLLNAPFHFLSIRKTVKKEQIDVILSANILPSFLAKGSGAPIVFDYLDHLEESASIYYPDSIAGSLVKKGVRQLTRFNLRNAKAVITVTNELKDYLSGIGIGKISVIPNGVDTTLLHPQEKEQAKDLLGVGGKSVLGYVGSLEYWVDLETAIDALPELPGTVLLIVGPGLFTDYGSFIAARAKALGVEKQVIFTGAVPYQDIGRYIAAMDIGLNPLKRMKKNEYAAGGKVFNYLACGRPVLSSRMVSLERLLGNELFYYDDAGSFVSQVKVILGQKEEDARYRQIAMRFDWKVLAEHYESVLEEAA